MVCPVIQEPELPDETSGVILSCGRVLSIEIVLHFWHGSASDVIFHQNGYQRAARVADKRDIRRIRKRLSIRFGIDEAVRVAFTEDVSMTGMFIKTPNIVTPNSKVIIELILPDGTRVVIEARVMWAKKVPQNLFHLVKKSGMGVHFLRFHAGEDAFDDFFESIATPG
jgi:hypothetical protein